MPHPSASLPDQPDGGVVEITDLTSVTPTRGPQSLPPPRTAPRAPQSKSAGPPTGTTARPTGTTARPTGTTARPTGTTAAPRSGHPVAAERVADAAAANEPAAALQLATSLLIGCDVLLLGVDHEPDGPGYAVPSLAIADHLATVAQSVTVLTAIAHRPTWNLRERVRRSRAARAVAASGDGALPAGAQPAGAPRVVRLDYNVAANQTAITRAAYEATRLASAAVAACPRAPGLVIATTPSLGGVVAAARVARKHGAPLVVVVHDLLARSGGGHSAVAGTLEQHALTSADVIAVMDEAFRAPIEEYGVDPERIHAVPPWAQLRRSSLGRRQARAELGWPTRGVLVVLACDLGLRQDVGNVVEAARLLADRHDLRFMVVGDGPQRRLLQDQARGLAGVRFKDRLDDEVLPLALAAADVLLVNERPTLGEGTSAAALARCLGAGRPVVAAVHPGGPAAREAARSRGAAVVVPSGDPVALADAVRHLVDQPQLRLTMADRALEHARTGLAHRDAMTAVDDVIEAALTRRW